MSNEDKQLLLTDLCGRLPYDVIGVTDEGNQTHLLVRGEADFDIITSINYRINKFGWKPYLRPMSDMTSDEYEEWQAMMRKSIEVNTPDTGCGIGADKLFIGTCKSDADCIDWLNKYHFDYRGLISKGLALPAQKGMYNIK